MGHAIRALTDANPLTTILSIDGIGAYDHVYRSAFLKKLLNVPSLQGLLPFVRATYADPTSYAWVDEAGEVHHIVQAEGGEQGDPLLLFSLAIHDPLEEASRELRPEEHLFAHLDDVYFSGDVPNRTRTVYDSLGEKLFTQAGIRLHSGKTRVWNRASVCPEGMAELGPEVWNPESVKVLGTPVGSRAFVDEVINKRLREEQKLWEAIPWVPDLQAGWQILIQCAGPRCHHIIRTLPPSQSADYAQGHDEGMKRTMDNLLGGLPGEVHEQEVARNIASLPMRMGGLGIRSAQRMALGAFWASWADALHMIDQRLPTVADRVVNTLRADEEPRGCLGELRNAAGVLDRHGFVGRPSWNSIRSGVRPEGHIHAEPGEWSHGWQYYASSSSEYNFRKNVVLNQSCAAEQAHLRPHSGPGASDVLCGCPSKPEFRIEAGLFRTLILERARLPLQVVEARCECGTPLDSRGRHRPACSRSGRLKTRALAPERTLASVPRSWCHGAVQRETP